MSSSSGTWDKDDAPKNLESPRKGTGDVDETAAQNGSLLKEIEETGEYSSDESEDSLKRYQEILQEQYVQEVVAKEEEKGRQSRKGSGRKKNSKLVCFISYKIKFDRIIILKRQLL